MLALLRAHAAGPLEPDEAAMTAEAVAFVTAQPDALHRGCAAGHLTGSAWIVDPARMRVVLVHHRQLGCWLQPGGHADGDPDLAAVAAREETGLTRLRALAVAPFDCDRHWIPERGPVRRHRHFDLRFFFEADPAEPLVVSDESHAVAWVLLGDVAGLNPSESLARMVRKTVRGNRRSGGDA